jgi:hypothetical protein
MGAWSDSTGLRLVDRETVETLDRLEDWGVAFIFGFKPNGPALYMH